MDPLHVPLTAASLLLVLSGLAKGAQPDDTHRALRLAGLPSDTRLVRALGVVEIAAGVGTLLDADRALWPLLVAFLYAGFSGFVILAMWRRAPLSSCGCFGHASVAPNALHAGVDAGLAAIAALAATADISSPVDVVRDGGADAIVLVLASVALTALLYALFTRPIDIRATSSTRRPR
jgi:uncharacterized protein YjeT (DUF2065 family)